jgi:hypothetical protein
MLAKHKVGSSTLLTRSILFDILLSQKIANVCSEGHDAFAFAER